MRNTETQKHRNTETKKRRNAIKQGLIVVLFSIMTYSVNAQLMTWTIPPNQVSFNPAPVQSQLNQNNDYSGLTPEYVTNNMHDASGNLLFYINDDQIYNKDGYLIDNLKINGVSILSMQDHILGSEMSIVPKPGSCTEYYIFGSYFIRNTIGGYWHPFFTVLNLATGTYGGIHYYAASTTVSEITSLPNSPAGAYSGASGSFSESFRLGMAVTPFRTATNNYFLYMRGFTGDRLYRYKIDANGLSFDNTPSDGGIVMMSFNAAYAGFPTSGDNFGYTEMEIIDLKNGFYQIGYVGRDYICISKVNYSDGRMVPNSAKTPSLPFTSPTTHQIYGLEFSPNGNFLYYSYQEKYSTIPATAPTYHIGYINLTQATLTPIEMVNSQYPAGYSLVKSFIEMGYDNKLYYNAGAVLYYLDSPDNGPSPANWHLSIVTLDPSSSSNFTYSFILPDQMDGNNYATNTATFSYTAGTQGSATYLNFASPNQTWTPTSNPFGGTSSNAVYTVNVLNNIIIPQGFNITIQGMTFKFNPRTVTGTPPSSITHYGAYVAVQDVLSATGSQVGGRLTLNNSVFTSSDLCAGPGMWEGVQVWGKPTLPQGIFTGSTAGKQGWFRMLNSSKISNAYIGAYAGRNDFDGSHNPPASGGGVIQAYSNSEFLNNQYGVYFTPYNNPISNVSTFNSVKFTTNALLNAANVKPVAMAQLMDVSGVQFRTCMFKNYASSGYPIAPLTSTNYGIYSYNSQFFCNPATVNTFGIGTGCTFENLKYGINATATGLKTVTADQNVFKNCYRGAYIANIATATFTRNKFFIYEKVGGTELQAAYGMYLDYCTGFKVQENKFSYNSHVIGTANDVASTFNVYGCIVNRSNPNRKCSKDGYTGDEIYKNDFQEIFIATQAQGDNSEKNVKSSDPNNLLLRINDCYPLAGAIPNNIGLVYRCNNYLGVDKNNLRITDYSLTNTKGNIAYQQGTSINPAGNRFSHDTWYSTATQNEIRFDATYDTYNPNNVEYVSQAFTSTVTADRTQPFFYTPYLNWTIPTGITNLPLTTVSYLNACPSKIPVIKAPISFELIKTSQDIIDAKTQVLASGDNQSLLDIIAMGNTGQLLNELMGKSPYLSDRMLIAAINKQLPPGHIKQIIIANSPVTPVVKSALDAVSLPEGIRNLVNAAQTGISERKKLEDIITENIYLKGYYYNEIIRYYLNDTLNPNGLDSVIKTVKGFNAPDNLCAVTKAYLAKGDYVKAQETVNDASAGGICNYLNTLIKIAQNPEGIYAVKTDLLLRAEVALIAADLVEEMRVGAMSILVIALDELSLQQEVAAINSDAISVADQSVLTWMQENPFQEWLEPIDNTRRMFHFDTEESTKVNTDISEIRIYPNPANNIVNISYQLPHDAAQAIVNTYDYTGKLLNNQLIYGNKGLATINVEGLPNGLYMYSIIVNSTTIATQRIVISK